MEKIIISVIVLLLFQGCSSHSSINKNHTLKNTSAKMLVYNKPQKIKTEKKRKKRVSCKNFSTQAHAQKYFDAKKHGWRAM